MRLVKSVSDLDLGLHDEIAEWLIEHWETYGVDSVGRRLFVACPWKDGHSVDSGETEAAWLMRGTGGMERGHFKCLHGSCNKRTDDDFEAAVGYKESGFDVITTEPGPSQGADAPGVGALALPLPGFVRNRVTGAIKATIGNVVRACEHVEACGWHIRYDTFLDDLIDRTARQT